MTVAEMLACAGFDGSEDPQEYDGIERTALEMARQYPREQRLYRRGEWAGSEDYATEPLDDFAVTCEYEARDVSGWYIVTSPAEFQELYDWLTGPSAPSIGRCGPRRAAGALRREAERLGWTPPEEEEGDA